MRLFSNITCTDIRGNITTRMDKLRDGQYDGIVLARAGLDRIGAGLSEFDVVAFAPYEMIPAVGQGLLAVQCREEDTEMRDLLFGLSPARAYLRFMIEREIFCRYRLNCRDAVGVYADINEETLKTDIMILAEPMSESDNDNLPNCETVE
jgi:porphobilinogen deaminase